MKTVFTIASSVVLAAVLYVLSYGPYVYATYRLRSDRLDELQSTFYPLHSKASQWSEQIQEVRFHYYVWWAEMARRHRGDPEGPAT